MRLRDSTSQLLAAALFADPAHVPVAIAVGDAYVVTDSGSTVQVILSVYHGVLWRDPLDKLEGCFHDNGPSISAAVGQSWLDPCFGSESFQNRLNLLRSFASSQKLPGVSSRHFVVKVNNPRAGLVFDSE